MKTGSRKPLIILAVVLIVVGIVALCCPCGALSLFLGNPEGDWGEWGESFGEDMDEWGREFGGWMDDWGRDFGRSMEDFGRSFGGVGRGFGILCGAVCGLCPLALILTGAVLVYMGMRRRQPDSGNAPPPSDADLPTPVQESE